MQIYSGDEHKFQYRYGNNSFFSLSIFLATAAISARLRIFSDRKLYFVMHTKIYKFPAKHRKLHRKYYLEGRKGG